MTLRTHTIEKKKDTHKQIWEWEETPELLQAIEQLRLSSKLVKNVKVPNLFIPNQNLPPKKYEGSKKD